MKSLFRPIKGSMALSLWDGIFGLGGFFPRVDKENHVKFLDMLGFFVVALAFRKVIDQASIEGYNLAHWASICGCQVVCRRCVLRGMGVMKSSRLYFHSPGLWLWNRPA